MFTPPHAWLGLVLTLGLAACPAPGPGNVPVLPDALLESTDADVLESTSETAEAASDAVADGAADVHEVAELVDGSEPDDVPDLVDSAPDGSDDAAVGDADAANDPGLADGELEAIAGPDATADASVVVDAEADPDGGSGDAEPDVTMVPGPLGCGPLPQVLHPIWSDVDTLDPTDLAISHGTLFFSALEGPSFFFDDGLYKLPVSGGAPTDLFAGSNYLGGSVEANSKWLFYEYNASKYVVESTTSDASYIVNLDSGPAILLADDSPRVLVWEADGALSDRYLLYDGTGAPEEIASGLTRGGLSPGPLSAFGSRVVVQGRSVDDWQRVPIWVLDVDAKTVTHAMDQFDHITYRVLLAHARGFLTTREGRLESYGDNGGLHGVVVEPFPDYHYGPKALGADRLYYTVFGTSEFWVAHLADGIPKLVSDTLWVASVTADACGVYVLASYTYNGPNHIFAMAHPPCDGACTICGDATCDPDEDVASCPGDCGFCGDAVCGPHEDAMGCPGDCGSCGDGVCDPTEDEGSCLVDCVVCGDQVCSPHETVATCGVDCDVCGDAVCGTSEDVALCAEDCGVCGDALCDPFESPSTCPLDCGTCGDHACNGDDTHENCPEDCPAPPEPEPVDPLAPYPCPDLPEQPTVIAQRPYGWGGNFDVYGETLAYCRGWQPDIVSLVTGETTSPGSPDVFCNGHLSVRMGDGILAFERFEVSDNPPCDGCIVPTGQFIVRTIATGEDATFTTFNYLINMRYELLPGNRVAHTFYDKVGGFHSLGLKQLPPNAGTLFTWPNLLAVGMAHHGNTLIVQGKKQEASQLVAIDTVTGDLNVFGDWAKYSWLIGANEDGAVLWRPPSHIQHVGYDGSVVTLDDDAFYDAPQSGLPYLGNVATVGHGRVYWPDTTGLYAYDLETFDKTLVQSAQNDAVAHLAVDHCGVYWSEQGSPRVWAMAAP